MYSSIPMFIVVVIIVIFMVSVIWLYTFGKDYWMYDNGYIKIYEIDSSLLSPLLRKRKRDYTMRISTNDIHSISIICQTNVFWNYFVYKVDLGIRLKDQSLIRFSAKLHDKNREKMFQVLKEIESLDISIHDEYHILEALGDVNINLYSYIIQQTDFKETM